MHMCILRMFGKKGGNKKPPIPATNEQTTSFTGNQQNTPSKRVRNNDDDDNQHKNKRVDNKNTPEALEIILFSFSLPLLFPQKGPQYKLKINCLLYSSRVDISFMSM